jgi:Fe-S-cluster containining protein
MQSPPKSACARCPAVLGRSCCEAESGEWLATLTDADVARMQAYLQRAARVFCEDEWLSVEEARAYELHRPLYAGYFRHGPKRLTLKTAKGACVLLDRAAGCVLPDEVRPTACRLYPFEPWPDGTFSVLATGESRCLAVDEADGVAALQTALGLSPEKLAALTEQLRREVQAHARQPDPG